MTFFRAKGKKPRTYLRLESENKQQNSKLNYSLFESNSILYTHIWMQVQLYTIR